MADNDKKTEQPDTFPIDRLIAESQDFLGVSPHVAAGALHGVTRKEVSLADAKDRVRKWRRSEVQR